MLSLSLLNNNMNNNNSGANGAPAFWNTQKLIILYKHRIILLME